MLHIQEMDNWWHRDGEVVQEHRVDNADLEHARKLAEGGVELHLAQRKLGEQVVGHVKLELRVAETHARGRAQRRARLLRAAGETELVLGGDTPEAGEAARCLPGPAQRDRRPPREARLRLAHDDGEAAVRCVRDCELEGRGAADGDAAHVRDVERVVPVARGAGLERGERAVVARSHVARQAGEGARRVVLGEHLEEHVASLAADAAERGVGGVAQQ
jgi:hypothetical protein